MTNIVGTITTALWILIELIQFAYMAFLAWQRRNDVTSRHSERARAAFAGA
jgi:hypothetical protein